MFLFLFSLLKFKSKSNLYTFQRLSKIVKLDTDTNYKKDTWKHLTVYKLNNFHSDSFLVHTAYLRCYFFGKVRICNILPPPNEYYLYAPGNGDHKYICTEIRYFIWATELDGKMVAHLGKPQKNKSYFLVTRPGPRP